MKQKISKKPYSQLKPGFSMIELMFVIIILGIVSSIGAQIITTVYEGYIVQRAQHRASIKTELAALQIANRLSAAIPGTLRRIKKPGSPAPLYEPIESSFSDPEAYDGLKWVGSDVESFSAASIPGWSGFCDVNASTSANDIKTPGSDLSLTTTIVGNLSSQSSPYKLYFPYDPNEYNATISGTTITLSGTGATHIVEHYKLAWSSYALRVVNGDLVLYYDFEASQDTPLGDKYSILMKNISTFRFKGAGRTLRFKICKEERITEDVNITACKEKAVF